MRIAVAKAAQLADESQFSYAINAARRSEKRRVHSFVRLLDYLVCNALHTLLVGGRADCLTGKPCTQQLPGLQPTASSEVCLGAGIYNGVQWGHWFKYNGVRM